MKPPPIIPTDPGFRAQFLSQTAWAARVASKSRLRGFRSVECCAPSWSTCSVLALRAKGGGLALPGPAVPPAATGRELWQQAASGRAVPAEGQASRGAGPATAPLCLSPAARFAKTLPPAWRGGLGSLAETGLSRPERTSSTPQRFFSPNLQPPYLPSTPCHHLQLPRVAAPQLASGVPAIPKAMFPKVGCSPPYVLISPYSSG